MIQEIQTWVWNIGGFLFTVSLFLLLLAYVWHLILNHITGWTNKETRDNLIYWLRHKNEINKIIDRNIKK